MADRVGVLDDELFGNSVGLVLALSLFVLHHAALQVELLLIEHAQQMTHAVALREQRVVQHGSGDILEIVCAIVIGRAVQVRGPNLLHGVDIRMIEVVAATEHQVLEQMGESGLARLLILRPHVIPRVHRNDRRLVVFMHQHGQPVGEHKLGVLDVRNRDVHTGGRSRRFVGRSRCRLGEDGDRIANHRCDGKQTHNQYMSVCFSRVPP